MLGLELENVAGLLLLSLAVIWAALLILGFLLGKPHNGDARRLPLAARMGMSVALVVAALVWWLAGTAGTPLAAFGRWIFLGMALGFLGDLFMAGLFPVQEEKIFGIVAFAIGHLFYIAAFGQLAVVLGLDDRTLVLGILAGYALIAIALWWLAVRTPAQPALLNVSTFVYALIIAAMSTLALALALQEPRFWPLFLGTLSFVASDLILANQFMRGTHWYMIGDVVWTTYTVGQMLIVYSSLAALHVLMSAG